MHLEHVSPSSVESSMIPSYETNLVSFPPCAYDMGMADRVKCHKESTEEPFSKCINDLQKSESLRTLREWKASLHIIEDITHPLPLLIVGALDIA